MSTVTSTTIQVKGADYLLEVNAYGFRLVSPDDAVYDVTRCDDKAVANRDGWFCSCKDHEVRHAGLPTAGCKHFQALQSAGLLDPPPAVEPAPETTPAPSAPAFTLRQPAENLSLPLAAPDAPPVQLTERYRPRRLADVLGQGAVRNELEQFLESPYSCAFLLVGPTGIGKTTTALALASELGVSEFSGLTEIKSGMQDAEAVESALNNLRYTPMFSQSGWKLVIVDEADYMSAKASNLWLSALEDLPPKSVIVFTTNRPEKFPDRFIDRTIRLDFESRAEVISQDAEVLVASIWARESLPGNPPALSDLGRIVDDNGALSFRRVVQNLGQFIRRNRIKPGDAPMAPAVQAAPEPPVESKPVRKPRKPRVRKVKPMVDVDLATMVIIVSAPVSPEDVTVDLANPDPTEPIAPPVCVDRTPIGPHDWAEGAFADETSTDPTPRGPDRSESTQIAHPAQSDSTAPTHRPTSMGSGPIADPPRGFLGETSPETPSQIFGSLPPVSGGSGEPAGADDSAAAVIESIHACDMPAPRGPIRTLPRKQRSQAMRRLFADMGLKGLSVTTPNYSMAHTTDIRVPEVDHSHPAGVEFADCPTCQRRRAAIRRLESIILSAFPDMDDRSDSHSDHHDFMFSID